MKSFREWRIEKMNPGKSWCSLRVDEYTVHVLRDTNIAGAYKLDEARSKGKSLGGQYSAQLHATHGGQGQRHIHVYARNNQIFALNVDGTAHDKSHGKTIPNKVADAIRQQFPSFTLPASNLIEYADQNADTTAIGLILQE